MIFVEENGAVPRGAPSEMIEGGSEEAEWEIKPLSDGRFRATFHSHKPLTGWQTPQIRTCQSEIEAMRWINLRLALRGFKEAYNLDRRHGAPGRG